MTPWQVRACSSDTHGSSGVLFREENSNSSSSRPSANRTLRMLGKPHPFGDRLYVLPSLQTPPPPHDSPPTTAPADMPRSSWLGPRVPGTDRSSRRFDFFSKFFSDLGSFVRFIR